MYSLTRLPHSAASKRLSPEATQNLERRGAFNQWLSDRRLKREGEQYADAMGHTVEAVNRRVPQLRWAGAERAQVLRAGDQLVRNTQDSGVVPGFARPPRRQTRLRTSGRNTADSGVAGGVM